MLIALLDCNNFYASCEKSFNPIIRHLPTIVLSNNDGCVIARSAESKALGIKMGAPFFEVRDLVAEHNIQVYSSNYSLYADISDRIMRHLKARFRTVEVYSIDEAFIEVVDSPNLEQQLIALKQEIWQCFRIPVAIGVAPTKTQAKLMNQWAKKNTQTGVQIFDKLDSKHFLDITVNNIWGVGAKYFRKLAEMNIHNIRDFLQREQHFYHKKFNVNLGRTRMELGGERVFELELNPKLSKLITCSRTFGWQVEDAEQIRHALFCFLQNALHKMQSENLLCQRLEWFISKDRFKEGFNVIADTVTFNQATDDHALMWHKISENFQSKFEAGEWRRAGVTLTNFESKFETQTALFPDVVLDSQGDVIKLTERPNWNLKRDYLSQNWTCNIEQIPQVF